MIKECTDKRMGREGRWNGGVRCRKANVWEEKHAGKEMKGRGRCSKVNTSQENGAGQEAEGVAKVNGFGRRSLKRRCGKL